MRNTHGIVFGLVPVGLNHGLLELDGCAQCVHGAREFGQCTITRQLDQAAAVTGQCRLEPFLAMLAEAGQCAALVPAHQARVSDDIRR
jgi:hypothetical protein